MEDDKIREIFLAHGFTVKEGQADLKPYVFAAARALIEAEIERLRQDAERYRWLRDRAIHAGDDGKETPWCVRGTCHEDAEPLGFEDLDAAVDAALTPNV